MKGILRTLLKERFRIRVSYFTVFKLAMATLVIHILKPGIIIGFAIIFVILLVMDFVGYHIIRYINRS